MTEAELHETQLLRMALMMPNTAAADSLREAAAFIRAQAEALNPPPPKPCGPLTYRSQ